MKAIKAVVTTSVCLLLISICLAEQSLSVPLPSVPSNPTTAPGPWVDGTSMPAPGTPDSISSTWIQPPMEIPSSGPSDEQCEILVTVYFKMSPPDREAYKDALIHCITRGMFDESS